MPRYIDAEYMFKCETCRHYRENKCNTFCDSGESYSPDMSKIPTADVAEVKHGEWIDKPTGAYSRMQSWCTVCGKHSGIGGIESNRHKPYCPNCGAKMDGGKTNDR
jgi:Zn finger protein HypA/HybF involved in hydrogenase expression